MQPKPFDAGTFIDTMNERRQTAYARSLSDDELRQALADYLCTIAETPPEAQTVMAALDTRIISSYEREIDRRTVRTLATWTGGITETVIQNVKERTDLVSLCEDLLGVPLKRGRSVMARCPFHDDNTPSLTIWPGIGRWKCYGCGAAGDAVEFVEKLQNMTFRDAVCFLAARAGIVIEKAVKHEMTLKPGRPEKPMASDAIKRRRLVPAGASHVTANDL